MPRAFQPQPGDLVICPEGYQACVACWKVKKRARFKGRPKKHPDGRWIGIDLAVCDSCRSKLRAARGGERTPTPERSGGGGDASDTPLPLGSYGNPHGEKFNARGPDRIIRSATVLYGQNRSGPDRIIRSATATPPGGWAAGFRRLFALPERPLEWFQARAER